MGAPLLEYDAFVPRRREAAVSVGVSFLILGLTAGLIVNQRVHSTPLPVTLSYLELLAPVLLIGAVVFLIDRWFIGRCAYVEVFEDRIILTRSRHASKLVVDFEDLASFRDESSDHIELVPREKLSHVGHVYLRVPTPDEETRRKLLALLDAGNVPRATV